MLCTHPIDRAKVHAYLRRATDLPFAKPPVTPADAPLYWPSRRATDLKVICAWCPDFDRTNPNNKGVSHGMCAACSARMNAELDALERA